MRMKGTLDQTYKALEEILKTEGVKDGHTVNGVEIWKDENTIVFEDETQIKLGTDGDSKPNIGFLNHEVIGARHIKVFNKFF